ncbi:MAG: DUF4286 family protein [Reyranellaceae bacterium]
MPLHGKGMLVVYSEAAARDERDLNEWYNREHIDERINLPGFHRARRYVAVRGSPKYLATYECDSADDLVAPGYLHILANPTPWTATVTSRFTRFNRMTLRVQVDLTHGIGGVLTTVRFVPNPSERHALLEWLKGTALPKVIARPGLVGAAAAENDIEIANAPLRDASMDRPRADEVEWAVLIEGSDASAVGTAARTTFSLARLRPFGVTTAPIIGTYRLLFGNQR